VTQGPLQGNIEVDMIVLGDNDNGVYSYRIFWALLLAPRVYVRDGLQTNHGVASPADVMLQGSYDSPMPLRRSVVQT